jgi:hypothetical protein
MKCSRLYQQKTKLIKAGILLNDYSYTPETQQLARRKKSSIIL